MNYLRIYQAQIQPKLRRFEECHIFGGAQTDNGYGKVRTQGKVVRAHRVAYIAHKGEIPQGLEIMHKCNTKLCCNPEHLEAGTHSQNMEYWSATGGTSNHAIGQAGLRGVYKEVKGSCVYWTARTSEGGYLKRSKDFFEACCARKAWEWGHTTS